MNSRDGAGEVASGPAAGLSKSATISRLERELKVREKLQQLQYNNAMHGVCPDTLQEARGENARLMEELSTIK